MRIYFKYQPCLTLLSSEPHFLANFLLTFVEVFFPLASFFLLTASTLGHQSSTQCCCKSVSWTPEESSTVDKYLLMKILTG